MGVGFGMVTLQQAGLLGSDGKGPEVVPATVKEMEEMLREAGRVKWVTVEEAGKDGDCCVDDRKEEPSLGIPGGNLGLVAVAVDASEDISRTRMSSDDMKTLVNGANEFNFHTDLKTLTNAAEMLKEDGVKDAAHLLKILTSPEGSGDAKLDEKIRDLAPTILAGCGYGALAGKQPEIFGVRGDLVPDLVRLGADRLHTNPRHTHLDVYKKAVHAARGVLEINPGPIKSNKDMVPTVKHDAKDPLFVICMKMGEFRLMQMLPTLLRLTPGAREEVLKEAMVERLNHHAEQTRVALASKLPYDVAHFDPKKRDFVLEEKIPAPTLKH